MYSVSEVAKITGVSNVAIYKKIKKLNGLDQYVVIKENKTYVLEGGLELIKQSLQVNNQFNTREMEPEKEEVAVTETEENKQLNEVIELNNKLINSLIEQLKVKDAQMEAKDKQISEQNEQILSLHKLIENNQVLLKEEQKARNEINLITEESLKKHQEEFAEKIESVKSKMNEKKKKKRRWFSKKEEMSDDEVC